VLIIGLSR